MKVVAYHPPARHRAGRHGRVAAFLQGVVFTGLLGCAALAVGTPEPAFAASSSGKSLGTLSSEANAIKPGEMMLIEADTAVYDLAKHLMSVEGSVSIHYGAYKLFADRVVVNRETGEVHASGNVILYDESGNVVHGDDVQLDRKMSTGIIQAMRSISDDSVGFTAATAHRTSETTTVFSSGQFLPCVDCNGVKDEQPLWQLKAKKIIRRTDEKTLTLENTQFELLGYPIAYIPWMSLPDIDVQRKSGFLIPYGFADSKLGLAVVVPYFWAISPSSDLTFATIGTAKEGVLEDLSYRQKLAAGQIWIGGDYIHQTSPGIFAGTSGAIANRGALQSIGNLNLSDVWSLNWSLGITSDRSFMSNYKRPVEIGTDASNLIEDIGVSGSANGKSLNAHIYAFQSQTEDNTAAGAAPQTVNLQNKLPVVHPEINYNVLTDHPIAGGEVTYGANLVSLSRTSTDLYQLGNYTRTQGVAGDFERMSFYGQWRRQMIDPIGEVFTPFISTQGDLFYRDPHDSSAGLTQGGLARVMPAAGLEYSYPQLVTTPVGMITVEPVAQIIARPNETNASSIANEDSQNVTFDSTSLFDINKFSGFDRVEGGGRANIGVRGTMQIPDYGALSAIFGQSYQLFGLNSFAMANPYDTGADSGLQSSRSDWVGGLSLTTNRGVDYGVNARMNSQTRKLDATTAQIIGSEGPVTASLIYSFLAAQPDLGITQQRSEIVPSMAASITDRFRLYGTARYDLANRDMIGYGVGFGFDEQSLSWSLTYVMDGTTSPSDRTLYLRLGLREIGAIGTSYSSASTH